MISVGIRLDEKVFPKPEEKIAKLPSTLSESPVMELNGIDKNGKAHINRIVLSRTADVELLRVESPSRIWVRLPNHITDKTLTFCEPFDLRQKTVFDVGDYALVPSDERVYRRCKILEINDKTNHVKVFCIDDAVVHWVSPECLAEMVEHYMFFPWQAIQVSMVGVYPTMQSPDSDQKWTTEACSELINILTGFPLLRVDVVLSSVVFNDYAKPLPVRIYGLVNDDHKTVSIAEALSKNVPNDVISMLVIDSAVHEVFGTTETEKEPETTLDIHKGFPSDWKNTTSTEEIKLSSPSGTSDWDPVHNQIKMYNVKKLREEFIFPEKGKNGQDQIMLAVEGRCTKSPYEWYARPIVKTGKNEMGEMVQWNAGSEDLKEVDRVDWMIYGNDELLSFAEQLDAFYSNPKNRKPLRSEDIKQIREKGYDVFAVCAVNEEKAMFTGEWQRVLILNCDDFAEVRFLDSGGRDMVLTSSLYRIHKQHCQKPPMCLQLAMHGVSTRINQRRVDKKWNIKERSKFKICLREDVPIFIDLNDLAESIPSSNDPRPFMKEHVLMARDVKYLGESKTVRDVFVGPDEGCADVSENDPVPWPVLRSTHSGV